MRRERQPGSMAGTSHGGLTRRLALAVRSRDAAQPFAGCLVEQGRQSEEKL